MTGLLSITGREKDFFSTTSKPSLVYNDFRQLQDTVLSSSHPSSSLVTSRFTSADTNPSSGHDLSRVYLQSFQYVSLNVAANTGSSHIYCIYTVVTVTNILVFFLVEPLFRIALQMYGVIVAFVTHAHTHSVGLRWTSDGLVAKACAYTIHNKYKIQTSVFPAGFETAIPAVEWPQTYSLYRTATGTYSAYNSVYSNLHDAIK